MRPGTRIRTRGPIRLLAGSEVVTVTEGALGTVTSARIRAQDPYGPCRVVAFDPGEARELIVAGPVAVLPEIDLIEI